MRTRRWGGFGTRLFLLTASVAVVAAGATAFLTVRQATDQASKSAEVAQQVVDRIVGRLTDAGVLRPEWDIHLLESRVRELADETRQRIRLTVGDRVVDSDVLRGEQPRSLPTRAALTIDPRPMPDYSGVEPADRFGLTVSALANYLSSFETASCRATDNDDLPVMTGRLGVPVVDPAAVKYLVTHCSATRPSNHEVHLEPGLLVEYMRCDTSFRLTIAYTELNTEGFLRTLPSEVDPPQDISCLQRAFRAMDTTDPADPLAMSLGTGDEVRIDPIDLGPALIAAAVVALIAILGTALLSRRVLRPVVTLTAAARQLGDGDLAERVPVRGRDQIAELATSFNRMAASLQASKEQQRTMVGDIAHELRTPLANIRGYLEALKDGVLAPDPALFQSLHEEAVLQQRLIDDLQDLAEAESGTMIYHRARLDVADLLSTSRTAHLAAAETRGVRLTMTVHGDPVIDGDADRLRQVIGNLITNALRATSSGGTVTLRTQAQPDAVFVAVADTGHGIATDDLPRVFDRFWRADNARSRSTGGSGLGLAIAREIVAAHQGSITVTSTLGKGAVFTMRFPVA
jgi:two-component system, OmpR family, sensor histidine kinase BaeS